MVYYEVLKSGNYFAGPPEDGTGHAWIIALMGTPRGNMVIAVDGYHESDYLRRVSTS
jgi:hypothetical protein